MLFLSFFFSHLLFKDAYRQKEGPRGRVICMSYIRWHPVKPSLDLPVSILSMQPTKKGMPVNNGEDYAAAP